MSKLNIQLHQAMTGPSCALRQLIGHAMALRRATMSAICSTAFGEQGEQVIHVHPCAVRARCEQCVHDTRIMRPAARAH